MRIFIGYGSYPHTRQALIDAGAEIVDSLEQAEGFVFTQTPGKDFPEQLPESIKWVQFPMAGINQYFDRGLIDSSRRWSNASGVYGMQVAESALAFMLALLHQHAVMAAAQSWQVRPQVDRDSRWLRGQTVVIVGMGGIGKDLAKLLEPFGCTIIGVGRGDDLLSALPQADHVVLAVPLTKDTRKMFGKEHFAAMKESAFMINVARGEVVDTDALVEALDTKAIAGAGLDVTDPEPLPDEHPLWGRDNVIITPHTANTLPSMDPLLAPVVAANYTALVNGERMPTEVEVSKGY